MAAGAHLAASLVRRVIANANTTIAASCARSNTNSYYPAMGSFDYLRIETAFSNATGLNRSDVMALCRQRNCSICVGGAETDVAYTKRITSIMSYVLDLFGLLPAGITPPTTTATPTTVTNATRVAEIATTTLRGLVPTDGDSRSENSAIATFMFSPAGIVIILGLLLLLIVAGGLAIRHVRNRPAGRAVMPLPPAPPPTADEVARAVLAITDFPQRDADSESTGSNYVELDRVSNRSMPLYDAATMSLETEKGRARHYDIADA